MPGVIRLAAANWGLDGTGVRVVLPVPYAARCAILAEGWIDGRAASAGTEDSTPVAFVMLGSVAFARVEAQSGGHIVVTADRPPETCRVAFQPTGMRNAYAPFLPVTARATGNPPEPYLGRLASECLDALGDTTPDRAIALLGEMLLTARGSAETQEAVLGVLRHAARRPLWRSTAFGALTAALLEEEAHSAWP